MDSSPLRALTRFGFPLSLGAWGVLLAAPLGTRWGLWDFRTGFSLLRVALWVGVAGALLGVAGVFALRGKARTLALGGLALGLAAAGIPYGWYAAAKSVPPIHDITTDWSDPPLFEAVLEARRDAPNSAAYAGPEVAEQQRRAYPGVQPLHLADKPGPAFAKALAAARELGWEIVRADPQAGRIEATDTTFWFGFKDDVVVRLTPNATGTRVDVRSVSRVGKGDVGANAKRIERFLAKLR